MFRVRSVLSSSRLLALPVRQLSLPKDVKYDQGPSYYVIPEISVDLGKGYPTLDFDNLPKIEAITPDLAFNGFSRLLVDYQLSLSRLAEGVKRGDIPLTYDKLFHTLEEIFYPVEHSFQALQSISSYNTDPVWPLILSRLYQKLKNSRTEYFSLDPEIYRALLTIKASGSPVSPTAKAKLDVLVLECWRQGGLLALAASGTLPPPRTSSILPGVTAKNANLLSEDLIPNVPSLAPSKAKEHLDRLRNLQAELENEEEQFQAMVLASSSVAGTQLAYSRFTGRFPNASDLTYLTGAAHIPIAESDLAPSAPSWLPEALGGQQNGGHVADMRVNIASDATVRSLLRHCSTRQVRESVWLSWVQRSSLRAFGGGSGQHAANDSRMQSIRRTRRGIAELLGCEDWLNLVWRSPYVRMPSSSEALVSNVLEPLRAELKPVGQSELQMLTEWSSAHLDLHGSKLEAWDIDYAIEQYNFAASHAQLQTHITPPGGKSLSAHVHTLLDQLASLFRLRLVPKTSAEAELPAYSVEDMDDGKFFGEMVLDIFHRPGRAPLLGQNIPIPLATRTNLSTSGTTIRPKVGQHSVVALLGNLPPSAETEGCQAQDILSIASGFGACLQHLLPRAHHHRLMGLSSCLAADMRYLVGDVCSAIMFSAILQLPGGQLKSASKPADHYSSPSVGGLRPPPGRIIALPLLRQLYEARFDLSLWARSEGNRHWITLDEQLWDLHLPYPKHVDDFWPCSASQLFGPNSEPGFQYQHVWRQVLIHDVLAALREHGWPANAQAPAVTELLKRFRDVIIGAQDLATPSELFREFRGRDPTHTFLLEAVKSRVKLTDSHVLLDPLAPSLVSD